SCSVVPVKLHGVSALFITVATSVLDDWPKSLCVSLAWHARTGKVKVVEEPLHRCGDEFKRDVRCHSVEQVVVTHPQSVAYVIPRRIPRIHRHSRGSVRCNQVRKREHGRSIAAPRNGSAPERMSNPRDYAGAPALFKVQ